MVRAVGTFVDFDQSSARLLTPFDYQKEKEILQNSLKPVLN